MRHIMVLTLLAAVALASGAAADGAVVHARTPGAQWVSLSNGNGRAVLSRRGSFLVLVGRGRIRVIDLPGGSRPNRSCNRRAIRVSRVAFEYRGRGLRCHVFGDGPWQVVVRGINIDGSGRVRGSLTLDAASSGATGRFSIGQRPARRWPRAATTFELRQ
jgi:hypothetical protein